MGATSFIVGPHRDPERGDSEYHGKYEQHGALWLRNNSTGRLTLVRPCPVCGANHYPGKQPGQEG